MSTALNLSKLFSRLHLPGRSSGVRQFFGSFSGRFLAVAWIATALLPPIYLFSEYIGLLQYRASGVDFERLYNLEKIKSTLATRLKEAPDTTPVTHAESSGYSSSLIGQRVVVVTAYPHDDKPPTYTYANDFRVTYDVLIVVLGLWLVTLYSLRVLSRRPESEALPVGADLARAEFAPTSVGPTAADSGRQQATRVSVLLEEVAHARARADQIYARSTLMLVAGVVMAFVGISVFYISIPRVGTEFKLDVYLLESIRPTAMLFFLEALAWFLLRQYRLLADEYRRFHQSSQRRADLLVAFLSLEAAGTAELSQLVHTTLLQDAQQLVLKTGETTEALEASKSAMSNPLFDLATMLAQRIPLPKQGKQDG